MRILLTTGRRVIRFLTFSPLNLYSNSVGRSAILNRNSICIRSIYLFKKMEIRRRKKIEKQNSISSNLIEFYHIFNQLRSMSSYCFHCLKYINLAMLNNLFNASICSTIYTSTASTIAINLN